MYSEPDTAENIEPDTTVRLVRAADGRSTLCPHILPGTMSGRAQFAWYHVRPDQCSGRAARPGQTRYRFQSRQPRPRGQSSAAPFTWHHGGSSVYLALYWELLPPTYLPEVFDQWFVEVLPGGNFEPDTTVHRITLNLTPPYTGLTFATHNKKRRFLACRKH